MPFQKGLDKVQEVAQRSTGGGQGGKYIGWKSGETKTIRFLSNGDEIVLSNLHEFVQCADTKKRSFVCRQEVGQDCPLCEDGTKRREVAFGIAVERETSKGGKTTTKTEEVEVEEDGKTVTKVVPVVGILHQAPRNFWGWFYEAFERYGTLLDRDYTVTRRGQKLDTTYSQFAEDKDDSLDLSKFDQFKPNLEEILTRQASKEYYDKFLYGIDNSNAEAAKPAAAEATDLTPEDLAELRKANEEVAATAASGDWD